MTGRNDGRGPGARPDILPTPERAADYLKQTEKMIRTLKEELKFHRNRRNPAPTREDRGDEMTAVLAERARLSTTLDRTVEENRRLMDRIVELETALAQERRRGAEGQELIKYLEAQVVELESMVQLLAQHSEFMTDDGGE